MQKIFVSFLVVVGLAAFVLWRGDFFGGDLLVFDTPSPQSGIDKIDSTKEVFEFESSGLALKVAWIKVADTSKISLHSNLESQRNARTLMEQNKCQNLVSGGFYTKENQPIGLFVTGGESVSKRINSTLFDGIFAVKKDGNLDITTDILDDLRFGLQSGPILLENGQSTELKIKNDAQERRVVVATTEEDQIVFLIFYGKESLIQGPYLADLPGVVLKVEEEIGVEFKDAVNLDGGTASAFYSDDLTISELTLIGSYFCIK